MMRLEEIADRLGSIRSVRWEEETYSLEDDIRTAIAERALPPSAQWVDAAIGGFNLPDGVRIVGMQGRWDVFRVFGHTSVHLASIATRGQLLDLLSGLGVRK